MSAQAEARQLVELIAGPVRLGENVKAALARVAQLTGLGDRRVRGIWNGEARRIEAAEMDRLRQVAIDARIQEDAARAYRAHLARLEACRQAVRVPPANVAGDADHGGLGLARTEDRSLDRGAV
ncbi:hypothetical protein [Methylobacterium sp. WSM2598]|uniref:hypothetical protein n=1 Tax=Methylobacterium sp. WSM2598 TaxID=398261 RepID=UPI0012F69115|nr:hypothetical protein [Methylobacterium sp. WSM2598]